MDRIEALPQLTAMYAAIRRQVDAGRVSDNLVQRYLQLHHRVAPPRKPKKAVKRG